MATLSEQVEAINNQPSMTDEQKSAAVAAVVTASQAASDRIWTILVSGLLGIAVLALVGLVWSIVDGEPETSPDLLVTAFTASLTGLLGLFIKK